MLKRILILAVMVCLLLVVSVSRSASASGYCSCGMVCSGGGPACQLNCYGDNFWDILAAGAACCESARQNTPIECPAN